MKNNILNFNAIVNPLENKAITKIILFLIFVSEAFILYLVLFEKFIFLLLGILLVGLALVVLKPIWGLYLSTAAAYSGIASSVLQGLFLPLILFTTFAWILNFLSSKDEQLVSAPQNKLLILWGAIMLFSSLYAVDIEMSMNSLYGFAKYLFFYFLIINLINSWNSIRQFIWIATATGFLMILYGIYTYLFSDSVGQNFRLISFVEDPNSLAIKLVPLVAFSYILIKTEHRLILKILSFLFLISMATAILFTLSRGGLLALFTVLFLIGLKEGQNRKNFVIILGVIMLAILIVPWDLFLPRIKSISKLTSDVSIIQRLKILKGGVAMFFDHPLFGVGVGNFLTHSKIYTNTLIHRVAHNSYLEVAAETGILGITFFLALLFMTLKKLRTCWKYLESINSKYYYYPLGIMIGLIGFMVHALFLSEQYNVSLFIVFALSAIISNIILSSRR
ncbi:MAG: hypothetical protein E2O76_07965 [Caldithrix sp.]|nr:MAG: hypothetical protein E2O76_07965 [Caldithrix sp.]